MHRVKPVPSILLAAIALVLSSGKVFATTFTTFSDPLGVNATTANGISGNDIVGEYTSSPGHLHGFLYDGSTFTPLDDPSATSGTVANGISGNHIVGQAFQFANGSGSSTGFLYNTKFFDYIDLVDPSAVRVTAAEGISGNNVVGFYDDSSGLAHGFDYSITTATYTTLDDPLAGATFPHGGTEASSISGNNVVGFYTDASGNVHGFLYNGSTWTTLDDPLAGGGVNQGTIAEAMSGNDIVGIYYDASDNIHGFLYNGSTYTTLDDPLGVEGTFLTGISGNTVVGFYQDASGEYGLITSVPEPSSLVLFGIAIIGFAVVTRRGMRKQPA